MSLKGRRVHFTGSASVNVDGNLLKATHDTIRLTTTKLIDGGAGLVMGIGGEPKGDAGHALTFDWTLLEVVAECADPGPSWPPTRLGRFCVVCSQAALSHIPEDRKPLWEKCRSRSDFEIVTPPPGWRMGGEIRTRQAARGDILVAVGGGAGTEHLAEMYMDEGKSVIPIKADLGSIVNDGNGGSSALHARAMTDCSPFFVLRDGAGSPVTRLSALVIQHDSDCEVLSTDVSTIIANLKPPIAFYVRLVAPDHPDFAAVEGFFRQAVDPIVSEKGFTRHEVGTDPPTNAFMNVEIFQTIYKAGLVVVDLTGLRPNCFMELGFALGRHRRVLISAKDGTSLPFDPDKLPTFFWSDLPDLTTQVAAFRTWFERHLDMPPVGQ